MLNCPLPDNTILDGELIVTDSNGKPDFEAMMTRFQSNRDRTSVIFCAFDILCHEGTDVTRLPLMSRKELLNKSFIENDFYKKVQVIEDNSIKHFNITKQNGLEGIVIKDKRSRYEIGKRSWSWQKVINWTIVDVFITGFRKKDFGWLVSVELEGGNIRPVGVVELGVTSEHRKALNSVKRRLICGENKNFVYMEPLIKAKVKTRNWIKNGNLRSPVFVEFII